MELYMHNLGIPDEVVARLGESESLQEFRFAVRPLYQKLTEKHFNKVTEELWNSYWTEVWG